MEFASTEFSSSDEKEEDTDDIEEFDAILLELETSFLSVLLLKPKNLDNPPLELSSLYELEEALEVFLKRLPIHFFFESLSLPSEELENLDLLVIDASLLLLDIFDFDLLLM